MFNVVERHQKMVKGLLMVITATFVVWGVSGYLGMSGDDGYIAKVGSKKIYSQDIDQAMDSAAPSQNQDKMQVLFGLINRQLLLNSISDNHLSVTTTQLQQAIMAVPLFQTAGKFDVNKYEDFLKQRYTTSAKFETDISQQILIGEFVDFFKNSYFTSTTFQNKFAALLSRQRNVSQAVIDPKQFYAQINPSESDINAFYQQNISKFTVPDQVKLQYLQLSVDDLAKTIQVSDAEVIQYLAAHPSTGVNEQIDASHILFSVPADASAEQKTAIKAKAEQVLTQVRANPSQFAALAKQYSGDSGSAANGGDLGYFGRGVMVKPFESVAFALHKGQISNLVETQFGYHIIMVNAIKENNLNDQKTAAVTQLQKQKAQQQLQDKLEQLNDLSYNKPDSLAPAAQKLGLTLQSSTDWVAKGTLQGLFANPKLQSAIFSDDVLKKHHNSEVIDQGNGSYLVLRVNDYKPSSQQDLATVKAQIIAALKQQQAAQMASQQGAAELAALQQGKASGIKFTNPESVTLLGQSGTIDPQAVKQIFALPAQFPAYTGALNQAGAFVLYQVNSQSTDNKLDAQNADVVKQLSNQYSMMTLNAYVSSLRSQYSVSYKLDRIKANDNAGAN